MGYTILMLRNSRNCLICNLLAKPLTSKGQPMKVNLSRIHNILQQLTAEVRAKYAQAMRPLQAGDFFIQDSWKAPQMRISTSLWES